MSFAPAHARAGGRSRLGALFSALGLLLCLSAPAQAGVVSLFKAEAAPRAADPAVADAGSARVEAVPAGHSRLGRVDDAGLRALRESVVAGRPERLRLNLFNGLDYEAVIERSAPTANGFSLSGPLADVPFGRVVLVVNGGHTVGRVYTPEGTYAIRTTGTMQTVERLRARPQRCAMEDPAGEVASGDGRGGERDAFEPRWNGAMRGSGGAGASMGRLRETEPPLRSAGAAGTDKKRSASRPGSAVSPAASLAASDDGGVVDVLVVYPSFAREIEGGYEPLLALIDLDIATANEAYAASGVEMRIELVAAIEVEYDRFLERVFAGTDKYYIWRDAVDDLAGRDDGYLDEVHALRDRYAADLVLMHLGGEVTGDATRLHPGIVGIAHPMPRVSAETLEESGFSVALSGDGTVVAHELGHSMGLWHDRYADRYNEPFPYSHGFRYEHAAPWPEGPQPYFASRTFGTIMSQYSGIGHPGFVLTFSNPELRHPQNPELKLGVPGDEPSSAVDGPADAARHLNELRGTLANVRARADADPCRYAVSGDEGVLPAAGGTHRVRVETGADCAWEVSTGDWVASVSAAGGTGSAEIEVTVAANDNWERPVEVLVSGQLHRRRQAGTRPITPVCERSEEIRWMVMRLHPDRGTAGEISYTCRYLNLDAAFLASVRDLSYADDSNQPTPIDASEVRLGDFDGLTGLVRLRLEDMETVPAGLFDGLVGLRILEFRNWFDEPSTLAHIEPGAFRGLPGLIQLDIWGHRVRTFRAGTFSGMPHLRELLVDALREWEFRVRDPVSAIEPGAFSGLPRLLSLTLWHKGLRRLDAGVFEGLHALKRLRTAINALPTLPVGAFEDLSELERLYVFHSGLTTLPAGVFEGLTNLDYLVLNGNRLSRIEPELFAPLKQLRVLDIYHNRLARLAPAQFPPLLELTHLGLGKNRIAEIAPGAFESLPHLEILELARNHLTRLEPGTFEGLKNLRDLYLDQNKLTRLEPGTFEGLDALDYLDLVGNRLGPVRAGTFAGLHHRLNTLNLGASAVTGIEPGLFDDTPRLQHANLFGNRIWALSPGVFRGLTMVDLDLRNNPGAPFALAPTPVALPVPDPVTGQPREITVEIAPVAPFHITVDLAASDGALSSRTVEVPAGEMDAGRVTVTPDGDGPVTVRIDRRPAVASGRPTGCRRERLIGQTGDSCFRGVRVPAGRPLVLHGIGDRELTLGRGTEAIDLNDVFSYFVGGADYAATSSDEAVAAVAVEGGTLTVAPAGPGTATVTVTATGADGETVTRRFAVAVRTPSVPLFLAGSEPGREGFVRLVNHSEEAGEVRVTAVDGGGVRRDPVTMRIGAHAAVHFNSGDLEDGNAAKGLSGGVGPGDGGWRLEFESGLEIGALAYVRTTDGFLTGMHDIAPAAGNTHRVATFNPADNVGQVSRLRVINPGAEAAAVTVRGIDDSGASPGGAVTFTVPAGAAREYTAAQLEAGGAGLSGALGDGTGKWRLVVESGKPVAAMSLLENVSTGHLTNLSSVPVPPGEDGVHHLPLFPSASGPEGRQGFARVVNRTERDGTVEIVAYDDAGGRHGPLELALRAGETAHFNSEDLELGNAAKGLSGSTGAGEGDWRLELRSELEIEALSYVRTGDGFLTSMHDLAARVAGAYRLPVFNPGDNRNQVSRLRLVNPHAEAVEMVIAGVDDTGWSGGYQPEFGATLPGGTIVTVPAYGTLQLTAAELEAGVPEEYFEDSWLRLPLGDGAGKWRLVVTSDVPIMVMSLLESPTGHLTNLSTAPGLSVFESANQ